jgi:hypothetical protein
MERWRERRKNNASVPSFLLLLLPSRHDGDRPTRCAMASDRRPAQRRPQCSEDKQPFQPMKKRGEKGNGKGRLLLLARRQPLPCSQSYCSSGIIPAVYKVTRDRRKGRAMTKMESHAKGVHTRDIAFFEKQSNDNQIPVKLQSPFFAVFCPRRCVVFTILPVVVGAGRIYIASWEEGGYERRVGMQRKSGA